VLGLVARLWQRLLEPFMPYDLYERHAVTGQLLRAKLGGREGRVGVLDVGGRADLLERFVGYPVISVNPDGSGDLAGSGFALPFADGSFSAVVSIDTLEHLPREERFPFLRECLRVARHYLLVVAPLGSEGHRAYEERLDRLYREAYGEPHLYLSEHVCYGLPNVAELDELADDLPIAESWRLYAGDYLWQGKQFERAIAGRRRRGLLARLSNLGQRVTSWALFHPVRLRDQPEATTNRFYWLMAKRGNDARW
jgi:SAM-dependent methyltransferase